MQDGSGFERFPPWGVMVTTDLLLIAVACTGTTAAMLRWRALRQAGATPGVGLILVGLWCGVSLYIADLYLMISEPDTGAAMPAMTALHLTYSWYFNALSAVFILAGLVITVLQMVRQTGLVDRQRLALEDSESVLRSVFENVPVGLLIKDENHIVERPNRTYTDWYGFDTDTMIGRRSDQIEDFQRPDEAAIMNEQERHVLTTGNTLSRQVERTFAGGERRILNITKFPIHDPAGNIIKVGSVSVDLTEQVSAQRQLAESEARFRDFAEVASDWLWEMDADLRFSYFSRRTGEIIGFDPRVYLGRRRTDVAGENKDQEKWRRHLEDLENHRPFRDFEYQFRDGGGNPRIARISGKPLFSEDGRFAGYRGTGTDVTEERRAQRARDAALRSAEEANRAKSEFLAAMSHELRTPLNAILGFSDILANDYFGAPNPEKRREYAGDIHASASHLLDLVNDLLDISAIEAGRTALSLRPEPVGDIIADCAHTMTEVIRAKDIDLRTGVPDGLPPIHADRRAIKQTLLNLLSNAVKFTEPGGRIAIMAENGPGVVRIRVSDTGIGIPPERLDDITAAFAGGPQSPYAGDPQAPYTGEKGWGLGLAISRSLVEMHGGAITIDSRLGEGTTVTVDLPEYQAPAATG
ncbi:MAG: PAS domain-containing sensor histidine kinase [Rhodospirillales bacterium]